MYLCICNLSSYCVCICLCIFVIMCMFVVVREPAPPVCCCCEHFCAIWLSSTCQCLRVLVCRWRIKNCKSLNFIRKQQNLPCPRSMLTHRVNVNTENCVWGILGKTYVRILGVQPEFCRKGGGVETPCRMGCGNSSVNINHYWGTYFASYITIIYHDFHQNTI